LGGGGFQVSRDLSFIALIFATATLISALAKLIRAVAAYKKI